MKAVVLGLKGGCGGIIVARQVKFLASSFDVSGPDAGTVWGVNQGMENLSPCHSAFHINSKPLNIFLQQLFAANTSYERNSSAQQPRSAQGT